jgi:hypothetical protein
VDDEKDKITMTFDTKGKTYIKMSQNSDNSFTMSVNKSALEEKSQSILLQIKLKDDKNPDGVVNTLMLNVKYNDQSSKDAQSNTEESTDQVAKSTNESGIEVKDPQDKGNDKKTEPTVDVSETTSTARSGIKVESAISEAKYTGDDEGLKNITLPDFKSADEMTEEELDNETFLDDDEIDDEDQVSAQSNTEDL